MKYNVGDKVQVRIDLQSYQRYSDVMVSPSMLHYKGKICTISGVNVYGQRDDIYTLEGISWLWQESMLEPVKQQFNQGPLFRIGDKVRVKKRVYKSFDYSCGFVDEMAKLENSIFTIKSVNQYISSCLVPEDGYEYRVYENDFWWSSGMLELVKEEKSNKEDSIEHAFSTRNYPEEHYYGLASTPIYMPTYPSLFVPKLDLETPLKQTSQKRIAKSDKSVILKLTHKSYKFK